MPNYTITYFNARGFAEVSRWICQYAEVEYNDHRIKRDEWSDLKPKTPFGVLPMLEIDGEVVSQSSAMAFYLADVTGLGGATPLERAKCVELFGAIQDMFIAGRPAFNIEDKDEKMKKIKGDWIPNKVFPFYNTVKKNLEGKEWYNGNQMTWADLLLGSLLNSQTIRYPEILDNYPTLKAHMDKVCALPAIKAWIKIRPVTEF